jgi:hypothetical protein
VEVFANMTDNALCVRNVVVEDFVSMINLAQYVNNVVVLVSAIIIEDV